MHPAASNLEPRLLFEKRPIHPSLGLHHRPDWSGHCIHQLRESNHGVAYEQFPGGFILLKQKEHFARRSGVFG